MSRFLKRMLRPFRGVRYGLRLWLQVAKNPNRFKQIIDSEYARLDQWYKSISEAALDTNYQLFYTTTGVALTRWALVEQELVVLFAVLLPTKPAKAGLILYSTINFQNWLTMIDELFLMDETFSSFLPRWRKIAETLRSYKDYRDRLAHHPVSPLAEDFEAEDPRVVSRPPMLDVRMKQKKFKPLDSSQVRTFSKAMASARGDLQKLTNEMIAHVTSQQKSHELSQHQSTADAQ